MTATIFEPHVARTTHGQPRSLKELDFVQFMPATSQPTGAVVFVHGYSGDGLATWSQFSTMLPLRDKCRDYDLFFYGYDGLRSDIDSSVDLLRQFVIQVAEQHDLTLDSVDLKRSPSQYNQIVLVGHSLGGVLTRWALAQLLVNQQKEWAKRVRLVLFAPAHSGARVDALAASVYEGYGLARAFVAAKKFKSPLIDQLAPGSSALGRLLAVTRAAIAAGQRSVVAKAIVRAEKEWIVDNAPFIDEDPLASAFRATFHETVCKPTFSFREPVDFVDAIL